MYKLRIKPSTSNQQVQNFIEQNKGEKITVLYEIDNEKFKDIADTSIKAKYTALLKFVKKFKINCLSIDDEIIEQNKKM